MRKIRGWVKTLANASGPPSGTVDVYARDNADVELGLETHGLGYLDRTHQTGGAGSINLADAGGHFGWDMEFSPGPITTRITARDPEPWQYRMRLPDESAQVGKAFHSDLERLGWAAGRDCLVYGAIEGAAQPDAASWSSDPLLSSRQGDWSVADFGTGADAGRVYLSKGIGFLGGVVFSIENPNAPLLVPVVGEDAAPANGGTEDRWDLLVAWMDIADPNSATYGKQGISIQRGAAGEGIPALEARSGYRQMVLHALKMAAGGGVYTEVYDLRPWVNPPAGVLPESIAVVYEVTTGQQITGTYAPSALNTQLANNELILNPAFAWDGVLHYAAAKTPLADGAPLIVVSTEGRMAVGGEAITDTNFALNPPSGAWRGNNISIQNLSFMVPLRRIPAYAANGGPTASTRSWSRLRLRVHVGVTLNVHFLSYQTLAVKLWPVT